jgi:hypothetical protein
MGLEVDGSRAFPPHCHRREPAAGLCPLRLDQEESQCRAHAIQLLTLRDDAIAGLTLFLDPRLFAAFGLPAIRPI